jgi:hypothetical protein
MTRRVTVPPAASLDVPFEGTTSRAAVDVAVADADGFAGDNVRYVLTEPRGAPRVLIVSGGPGSTTGFYLARALEADDESGSGFSVRTVHGPEFAAMPAADVAHYSVVAILSTHGLDRRVRDLLRAFLGGGRDPHRLDQSDAELIDVARDTLADVMSISGEPIFSRIYRWTRQSPQYEVGHLERLAAIDAHLARVPGLFLTGSGFRSIGIPDCIADGRAAAERATRFVATRE